MHTQDVLDKDVYDANGLRLGHVRLAREAEGFLLFDVELTGRARRAMRTQDDTITFAQDDVVATDGQITLVDDAAHLAMSFQPSTNEA
jgi:hypothetical protein